MDTDLAEVGEHDEQASQRKKDHIELAFKSQVNAAEIDTRFWYEPLLSAHPKPGSLPTIPFLGKRIQTPIWVSSMTGGTEMAYTINHHLARACGAFGMGMGLGSCRQLLYSDDRLADFQVRKLMGDSVPLFANLGIAQLETLLKNGQTERIVELCSKLEADGLIVHVNPLQEWAQPEGDQLEWAPLETIKRLLDAVHLPLIVKEVGQGMGYQSLLELLQLPLAAVDFAASGGTNFAKLELLRGDALKLEAFAPVYTLGHSALEMVDLTNQALQELGGRALCGEIIISGGVKNFLDGYYLMNKLALPSVYGQASGLLQYAKESYELVEQYISLQVRGLEMANAYLRVR